MGKRERLGGLLQPILPGFPSLGGETLESSWHTGLDTDPWCWKDHVAEEMRLAYGFILGGQRGFVSERMYPIFYAAFHPTLSMPERWARGTVNRRTWQLWQLFEREGILNISQVRQILDVNGKQAISAVDTSIRQLQHEFYITVDGNDRKVSARGVFTVGR